MTTDLHEFVESAPRRGGSFGHLVVVSAHLRDFWTQPTS